MEMTNMDRLLEMRREYLEGVVRADRVESRALEQPGKEMNREEQRKTEWNRKHQTKSYRETQT